VHHCTLQYSHCTPKRPLLYFQRGGCYFTFNVVTPLNTPLNSALCWQNHSGILWSKSKHDYQMWEEEDVFKAWEGPPAHAVRDQLGSEYCTVMYCTILLYYAVLCCTRKCCTVLRCTVLRCPVVYGCRRACFVV